MGDWPEDFPDDQDDLVWLPNARQYDPSWARTSSGLIVPGHVAAEAKKPTAVDLFCGCGGFSLGIMEAGFQVLLACDNDPAAAITYMTNLGAYPIDLRFVEDEDQDAFEEYVEKRRKAWQKKHPDVDGLPWYSGSNRHERYDPGVLHFLYGDVSNVSGQELLDIMGVARGELDLVVGGPPCQGFSYVGQRKVEDARNSLVFDFARLCVEMQPRSLCMENVPGILSMKMPDGRLVMDELCAILERGDFGEFNALRQMLSADPTKRIARRKRKGPKSKETEKVSKKALEPKQQTLF